MFFLLSLLIVKIGDIFTYIEDEMVELSKWVIGLCGIFNNKSDGS